MLLKLTLEIPDHPDATPERLQAAQDFIVNQSIPILCERMGLTPGTLETSGAYRRQTSWNCQSYRQCEIYDQDAEVSQKRLTRLSAEVTCVEVPGVARWTGGLEVPK